MNYFGTHLLQKSQSLYNERGRISKKAKEEFYDDQRNRFYTRFNNWKVLKGSSPERRYFVTIPFKEEIVQLIISKMIPKIVPDT